jgi:hypothetical protein
MTIYEPATLLTDYLLTALGGWLAWRLHRRLPADNEAARWWGRALALIAAAAFVGGSSHGFGPNLPPAAAAALKTATLLTLSLVAAAMTLSLVYELAVPERRRRWLVLVGLKLGFFAALAVARPVFVVAIADYGLALVAWIVAALVCRRPWCGWMLAACGLSIIAALVQQLRWGLSVQFNHNDLYHVIKAGALYFFYRATLRLGAGVVAPNPPPLSAPAGCFAGCREQRATPCDDSATPRLP